VNDLERTLTALARELGYPPTPDIGPAVAERVRARRAPRRLPPRRTLAIALAALLLLAAGAVAAVPGARHSVLDWLGLRSVHIERAPKLPVLPPGRAGGALALGTRTTVAGARGRVSFRPLVPARAPDEVYVAESPPGGRVSLVYATGGRARVLIPELRAYQPRGFISKTLGPGTTVHPVSVNGERGVWIAGRPHEILYRDTAGQIRADTLRLATNTLLWRHGDVLVRIEAHVSKARALAIASSMR
jgi:hypothetical protein